MGGASKGFIDAGFDVIKAYDNWEDALVTHKYNLKDIETENINIELLQESHIPLADLYHFSCPCQSWSNSGKKQGIDDLKGKLIYQTIRILKAKQPKVFTFENVKGLVNKRNLKIFKNLIDEYKKIGYECYYQILNTYDYETVQNRERLILVGFRKDLNILNYSFPKEIPNNKKLKDIIGNINNNFGVPKHAIDLINKIKFIPNGGNSLDIPIEIRPKCFKNSYGRLKWDDIPPTITRNYNCPSSANCIHPDEHRGLSDKEALLIQGFNDSWEVLGSKRNLQIGNSIPPNLIKHIGISIINILDTL